MEDREGPVTSQSSVEVVLREKASIDDVIIGMLHFTKVKNICSRAICSQACVDRQKPRHSFARDNDALTRSNSYSPDRGTGTAQAQTGTGRHKYM
ncbi:unnamed protein product [Fusarium graminearum]|uniref:Uncharacterized protein n=1 Tax=Gibberella zeae TaxID=5518 RepID=A0A4E9DYP4_GIBZA|nr:unnamed protein product [Fusarium graminearum]CAF3600958.1 unnamed protein product [Fusarium graminearum]CAG1979015.1 unnamed protein product [Fusarium graminearum]CAG1990202.1 unnamed protein product [Fusarium graminearum]